jgi:hypothetical protein
MAARFRPGDVVVYRKRKVSARPGPRATGLAPAPRGELYAYSVDKFWRVEAVGPDGELVVRTRRGKRLTIPVGDPALRPAHWWERLFLRHRFPPRPPAPPEGDS